MRHSAHLLRHRVECVARLRDRKRLVHPVLAVARDRGVVGRRVARRRRAHALAQGLQRPSLQQPWEHLLQWGPHVWAASEVLMRCSAGGTPHRRTTTPCLRQMSAARCAASAPPRRSSSPLTLSSSRPAASAPSTAAAPMPASASSAPASASASAAAAAAAASTRRSRKATCVAAQVLAGVSARACSYISAAPMPPNSSEPPSSPYLCMRAVVAGVAVEAEVAVEVDGRGRPPHMVMASPIELYTPAFVGCSWSATPYVRAR